MEQKILNLQEESFKYIMQKQAEMTDSGDIEDASSSEGEDHNPYQYIFD